MRSRASCFNTALIRKNLSRFWPLMLLVTVALFLNNFFSNLDGLVRTTYNGSYRDVVEVIFSSLENGSPIVIAICGFICATCAFEYLHNTRSSNYIHSLPLHRGTLYCSGVFSGILLGLIPLLVSAVLGYLLLAVTGAFRDGAGILLLKLQAMELAQFLFFYALAVLAHILCGRRLHSLIAYAFFLFFLPVLEVTFLILLLPTLFGINNSLDVSSVEFCPIVFWTNHNYAEYVHDVRGDVFVCYDSDPAYVLNMPWGFTLICLALGALALIIAYFLYKKRHAETAGQGISFKSAYIPLQNLLALLSAELLTALVLALVGMEEWTIAPYVWLALILISSLLTFFLMDMLLRRTRKVYNKNGFKRFALYALVLTVILTVFALDLPHIVRRVPEVENIKSVTLKGMHLSYEMTDEEDLDAFTDLHREIIRNRSALMKLSTNRDFSGNMPKDTRPDLELSLTYTLKNGKTIVRNYDIYGESSDAAVSALYDTVRSYYNDPQLNLDIFDRKLEGVTQAEIYGTAMIMQDEEGAIYMEEYREYPLEDKEREELLNLYRADLATWNGSLLLDWSYSTEDCIHLWYNNENEEYSYRYEIPIFSEMKEAFKYARTLLEEKWTPDTEVYTKG